jgi:hypothetical protein
MADVDPDGKRVYGVPAFDLEAGQRDEASIRRVVSNALEDPAIETMLRFPHLGEPVYCNPDDPASATWYAYVICRSMVLRPDWHPLLSLGDELPDGVDSCTFPLEHAAHRFRRSPLAAATLLAVLADRAEFLDFRREPIPEESAHSAQAGTTLGDN